MSDTTIAPDYTELENYRTELTGYCYRMLGSAFEAEDAVQDTMVRAWKSFDSFEGRSSLRSWVYRIATNVCLTMLDGKQRRARPMDLGPSTTADVPILPKRPEIPWIEPMPDARAIPASVDPAEMAVLKESIRLAFVVALQHLPARQRAALILCDVLHWPASEAAQLLEASTASINSALQRARATLSSDSIDLNAAATSTDAKHQELITQYADSFERYDMDALVSLLHQDVVMSMPPYDIWLQGPDQVLAWLQGQGHGCEGSKVRIVDANGTKAIGQYRINPDGGYSAWALQVIEFTDGKITDICSFLDTPKLFPLFGLAEHVDS